MATDEDVIRMADEYAVQYFGFLPQNFMNGMYNLICEYLKEAMQALNDAILNKLKGDISEDKLLQISSELTVKAVERLDEKFDKAQLYLLGNVFQLPDHLVLPEDKIQMENPCSEEEMASLDGKIQSVLEKIDMVKMANMELRGRIQRIDKLQNVFNTSLGEVTQTRSEVHSQSSQVLQSVSDLGLVQRELANLDIE